MRSGPERRRWLTVKEVSVFLSVHEKTAYGWAARGLLPSVRVGGSLRIDLPRLEEMLERQIAERERRLRGGS